jgi:hypothetical protein
MAYFGFASVIGIRLTIARKRTCRLAYSGDDVLTSRNKVLQRGLAP